MRIRERKKFNAAIVFTLFGLFTLGGGVLIMIFYVPPTADSLVPVLGDVSAVTEKVDRVKRTSEGKTRYDEYRYLLVTFKNDGAQFAYQGGFPNARALRGVRGLTTIWLHRDDDGKFDEYRGFPQIWQVENDDQMIISLEDTAGRINLIRFGAGSVATAFGMILAGGGISTMVSVRRKVARRVAGAAG